jgi:uncharacterized protein (TIGR02001 family)
MTRGSFLAGILKTSILATALIAGLAVPGYADDAPPKLTLSGSAAFTTDYMFRSVSNTSQNPAVQPEFDLTYGMWFFTLWGSNTSFGGKSIEIDYYGGITPKWKDITFTIAGNAYTYPSSHPTLDYFELHTGASWSTAPWTIAFNDYWSPDNFETFGNSNAIDGTVSYAFKGKLWNFFTPSISGQVGFQSYEKIAQDYVYWNAGLTLGFYKNWSADVRYYDTNYNKNDCFVNSGGRNNCDARAVGTIKVTF